MWKTYAGLAAVFPEIRFRCFDYALPTATSRKRELLIRVYRTNIIFEPFEQEGAYDTVEQVLAHMWRSDRHYKIRVDGKYMTRTEFGAWAKGQK